VRGAGRLPGGRSQAASIPSATWSLSARERFCQDVAGFKVATSPVVSVVDVKHGVEVAGAAPELECALRCILQTDQRGRWCQAVSAVHGRSGLRAGTGVAYVTGNGIDAVFPAGLRRRHRACLQDVGASTSPFIALSPAGIAADKAGKGPIGIAIERPTRSSRWLPTSLPAMRPSSTSIRRRSPVEWPRPASPRPRRSRPRGPTRNTF